jgi:hypothetical protein
MTPIPLFPLGRQVAGQNVTTTCPTCVCVWTIVSLSGIEPLEDDMGRLCSRNVRDEKYTRAFGQKPEGMRSLGTLRCRLEDNIKMSLKEIVWAGVDLSHLSQDKNQWWDLVNAVMNFRVP